MITKIDNICLSLTNLINNYRNEMVNSLESYLSSKIGTFRLQLSKLEVHRNDLSLMQDDITNNEDNIQNASMEHLASPRFLLIVDKFDEIGAKLRNVGL